VRSLPVTAILVCGSVAVLVMADRTRAQSSPSLADPSAPSSTPETTIEGVTSYVLDNGLQVLLCPDGSSPTVTIGVTYLVGSRLEGPGEFGMTHMLEHMLAKRTKSFDSIWEALAARGGDFNATTWFDRTEFHETLPADDGNLDFALQVEAERMTSAVLDADELAREMEVIANELEYVESDPLTVLGLQTLAAAYRWHPYGRPTIGNLADIRSYPIESLRAFYRKHYRPDNAVLFVGGRFAPVTTRKRIADRFGPIAKSPTDFPDPPRTVEPPQEGPRLVTVYRDAGLPAVSLMYHVPAGSHADAPTLEILRDLLVGAPSGRLTRELVETGLATEVGPGTSDALQLAEPGVLEVVARLAPGCDPRDLLPRMTRILEELAAGDIEPREVELARARRIKRIRADFLDPATFGPALSEWIALGDWRSYFLHRDGLAAVDTSDVRRVAGLYLREMNRTAGVWIPGHSAAAADIPAATDLPARAAAYRSDATVPSLGASPATLAELAGRTLRMTIPPGAEIALVEKRTRGGRVVAKLRFRYGNERALKGHRAAARLLPDLLMRGTETRDHRKLREEIDLLQSDIELRGHEGVLGATVVSDHDRIAETLRLLGEIVRRPRLASEDFGLLRDRRRAEVEKSRTSPLERAFGALRRATHDWPPESLHHVPTPDEELAALDRLDVDEVRKLHSELLGAADLQVAIVGDFPEGEVLRALGEAFEGWEPKVPFERVAVPARPVRERTEVIAVPGQRMAVVAQATTLALSEEDPDFPALRLASWLFLEKSRARLGNRLRHEEGLSYHVSGALDADGIDRRAAVYAYAVCSPVNAERTLAVMGEEFQRWIRGDLGEGELSDAKRSLAGSLEIEAADDDWVAGQLLMRMAEGRSLSADAELAARIDALSRNDVTSALRRRLGDARFYRVRTGDSEGDG